MSGYQDTANRARAAGAKSSPPKPNGKAFARGAEAAAVSKGAAAVAAQRAEKARKAALRGKPATPTKPKVSPNWHKAKELGTKAGKYGKWAKGAGPALAVTAAYELADYGRKKREEGEKRGFTRYDSSLGSSGYVQTSQKNKEGKKWSDQRAEDRKKDREAKKASTRSTAGAYAMGSGGSRTTAVQRAADRRSTKLMGRGSKPSNSNVRIDSPSRPSSSYRNVNIDSPSRPRPSNKSVNIDSPSRPSSSNIPSQGREMMRRSAAMKGNGSKVYRVRRGDNLWSIAKRNNTTLPALLKKNPKFKKNPDLIYSGATVKF